MAAAKPVKKTTTKPAARKTLAKLTVKPKHNVLFVLCNGVPDEWAIAHRVPVGSEVRGVWVAKLDHVPDDLTTRSRSSRNCNVWDQFT